MPFGKRPASIASGDRRRSPREAAALTARVVLPVGKEIPCSIVEISHAGARVALQSVLGIPTTFELRIGRDTYCAQIVRRGVRLLAVRFR
jgi:hypothetical protein